MRSLSFLNFFLLPRDDFHQLDSNRWNLNLFSHIVFVVVVFVLIEQIVLDQPTIWFSHNSMGTEINTLIVLFGSFATKSYVDTLIIWIFFWKKKICKNVEHFVSMAKIASFRKCMNLNLSMISSYHINKHFYARKIHSNILNIRIIAFCWSQKPI